MNGDPSRRFFETIWEYLDFKRHQREISRTSGDGVFTASLRSQGSWLIYTLTAGEEARISVSLQKFRA